MLYGPHHWPQDTRATCWLFLPFYDCGSWGRACSSKSPGPEPGVCDWQALTPAAHFSTSFQVPVPCPWQIRVAWVLWHSRISLEALVNFWSGTGLTALRRCSTLSDLAPEFHRYTEEGFTTDSAGNFSEPKISTDVLYYPVWLWTFLLIFFFFAYYPPSYSFWHFIIQSSLLENGLRPWRFIQILNLTR